MLVSISSPGYLIVVLLFIRLVYVGLRVCDSHAHTLKMAAAHCSTKHIDVNKSSNNALMLMQCMAQMALETPCCLRDRKMGNMELGVVGHEVGQGHPDDDADADAECWDYVFGHFRSSYIRDAPARVECFLTWWYHWCWCGCGCWCWCWCWCWC